MFESHFWSACEIGGQSTNLNQVKEIIIISALMMEEVSKGSRFVNSERAAASKKNSGAHPKMTLKKRDPLAFSSQLLR